MKNSILTGRMHFSLSTHFILLILLTGLLGYVASHFFINEVVNHPQFDLKSLAYAEYQASIRSSIDYKLFFIVDTFWAFILLSFLYRIVRRMVENRGTKRFFLVLFVISFLLDLFENVGYFTFSFDRYLWVKGSLRTLQLSKEIAYSLSCLAFLFLLFAKYKSLLIKFVKSSIVSLVFILIVLILILFVDQGGDIIITLFESRFNLILTILLIGFVAVPTSHYPIYLNKDFQNKSLFMSRLGFLKYVRKTSLGIIYYQNNNAENHGKKGSDSHSESVTKEDDFLYQFLRRCLGVLFFVAFISMLLVTYDNVHLHNTMDPNSNGKHSNSNPIIFAIFFGLFWFTWWFSKLKQKADQYFHSSAKSRPFRVQKNQFITIVKYLFPLMLTVSFLMISILLFGVDWNSFYLGYVVITVTINAITFIIYAVGRSYLKYVFNQKTGRFSTDSFLELSDQQSVEESYYRIPLALIPPSGANFLSILSQLSNNLVYLFINSIIGWACFIGLLILNFNWAVIHKINPIPIFLMYYMVYYGGFVIFQKHRLYYRQRQKGTKFKRLWKYHIPAAFVTLFALGAYTVYNGNDLHVLPLEKRTPNREITIDTFINSVKEQEEHYFIATYGGGLKSNLWTMLVLNKLERGRPDFFKKVRCFSSVSGGSVGIANYMYMKSFFPDEMDRKIYSLGRLNSLSLDIVFLLGKDLLREYIPSDNLFEGHDRSYYGMNQHLLSLHDGKEKEFKDDITFITMYHDLFEKVGYYPPLIINSTNIKGSYGNALSLRTDSTYKYIFPGAVNTLNYNTGWNASKDYSLFRVASTSNRFPFVSPTARITKKGHFLDGGAFENSGLLSAYSFSNYLAKQDSSFSRNRKFISIINSKGNYVKQFIRNNETIFQIHKEQASAEILAVANVASSTEHTPNYIRDLMKTEEDIRFIYLPHKITIQDVIKNLGGTPFYKNKTQQMMDAIQKSNRKIDSVLALTRYKLDTWGTVQPATGRLLSEPSVLYQKAMIDHHPEVKKVIQDLVKGH